MMSLCIGNSINASRLQGNLQEPCIPCEPCEPHLALQNTCDTGQGQPEISIDVLALCYPTQDLILPLKAGRTDILVRKMLEMKWPQAG